MLVMETNAEYLNSLTVTLTSTLHCHTVTSASRNKLGITRKSRLFQILVRLDWGITVYSRVLKYESVVRGKR
jgi:hypothetical protein